MNKKEDYLHDGSGLAQLREDAELKQQPIQPIRWWCSLCGETYTFNTTEEIDKHVQDYHSNIH